MAYRIVFSPEVLNDIEQAVDWYNEKQKDLSKKFIAALKHNFYLLKKDPYCIAVKFDEIRCMPVTKFPYAVHYRIEKDSMVVVVFAIYHTSRNPEIWKHRK